MAPNWWDAEGRKQQLPPETNVPRKGRPAMLVDLHGQPTKNGGSELATLGGSLLRSRVFPTKDHNNKGVF